MFLWLAAPAPSLVWFYRPFTCNYLFAFSTHLLLMLPFRFALAGRDPTRAWLAPALALVGVLAGMSNEHTGPATILALIVVAVVLVRRGVRRAWILIGPLALTIGYAGLYLAPGQDERYGGTGARESRLGSLLQRGLEGAYDTIAETIVHAQLGAMVALAAIAVAVWRARRRGGPLAGPDRGQAIAIVLLIGWASLIVGTMLWSPRLGERLYFAPVVLLVTAALIALEPLLRADRALGRACAVVAVALVAIHAVILLRVQLQVHADGADRFARLSRAPAGSVAVVPAFRHNQHERWFWGDDFVYASLREYVAHDVFGLAGIEIEGAPRWVEPMPPFHFETQYRYEPPLDRAALEARVALPDYTATFWEWAAVQMRHLMPSIEQVDGHRLQEITVTVVSDDPLVRAIAHGRPILADRWKGDEWTYVYARRITDDDGWPTFDFSPPTIPLDMSEAWLVGCGESRPLRFDREHPDVSFVPRCGATYVSILCTPVECWLGGTFARFERPQ